MEAAVPVFAKGSVYAIINKALDHALKPKEVDPKKFEESRIIGSPYNPQDDTQLFFIEKTGKEVDDYEFVNLKTGLVFGEDGKEILLEFGNQKSRQLFSIVKANLPGFYTYYWIKTSEKGDKALFFEGILKFGVFDPNAQNQLFRFEQVKTNTTLNSSCILINKLSGKSLDVPGGSFKLEERIIQYEVNRRFNQRWRWVKHDKGYLIQNVLTGHFLDIAGQSRETGAKIIQWTRTGNPNQQWLPEHQGNGVFRIRSIHEPSMYLGIKGDSVEDGGKLQGTKEQKATTFWIVEGAYPA